MCPKSSNRDIDSYYRRRGGGGILGCVGLAPIDTTTCELLLSRSGFESAHTRRSALTRRRTDRGRHTFKTTIGTKASCGRQSIHANNWSPPGPRRNESTNFSPDSVGDPVAIRTVSFVENSQE